jgi:hypothetical protein
MKTRILLIIFVLVLTVMIITGCSTAYNRYNPPGADDPQATFRVHNNCNFRVYVFIDGYDAGSIPRKESRDFIVEPGYRDFDFTGTDTDLSYEEDYPVYFSTGHHFRRDEIYPMRIKFGVDF